MNDTYNNILPDKSKEQHFEIEKLSIDEIVAINQQRKLAPHSPYDPIAGVGCCGPRVERHVALGDEIDDTFFIPKSMAAQLDAEPCTSAEQWTKLRIKHDFEFWCATCVTILDKVSGRLINMTLNRPQRRVLSVLEEQRLAGKPLRLILLKARQWGGSTLVQVYMAWIQLVHRTNWNSIICGHLLQTASAIKVMYRRLLRNYPKHLCADGQKPRLRTFEGNRNVQQLSTSESLVISGSAQSQDAVRGYDVKMAHLTEAAFWPATALHSPDDVIRSVSGSVPLEPLTMVVIESTANGVDNYFHNEWLRAKAGESDKVAIFVPWHEIEIYRLEVKDVNQLIAEMDDYEKWLWQEQECTLEMINWYHHKRREYVSQGLMAAEFPTTDLEAFISTSNNVFAPEHIESLRHGNTLPIQRGDMVARGDKTLNGVDFVPNINGPMELWKRPQVSKHRNRYITVVDVGGRTDSSDWSVIAVIDRHIDKEAHEPDKRPEVVAQWRGHIDHDELVWKAAQIAHYYNNALLIFESNTLESEGFIDKLNYERIKMAYSNIYCRNSSDGKMRLGFQTNRDTKPSAIHNLIAYVRDGAYIERDSKAADEMECYEFVRNAPAHKSYSARRGKHDDILMTRAIGLLVIENMRLKEGRSRAINPDNFIKKATLF